MDGKGSISLPNMNANLIRKLYIPKIKIVYHLWPKVSKRGEVIGIHQKRSPPNDTLPVPICLSWGSHLCVALTFDDAKIQKQFILVNSYVIKRI